MSPGGKALLLSFVTWAATGCGPKRDFYVHELGVRVESSAPFASSPDLPARVESTIDVALRYWGGEWAYLTGSTLILVDAQFVSCGASSHAIACYDGDLTVSTRDPALGTWSCVEETALVHEVGHAVIGDAEHTDPRWMDFLPVLAALDGRSGYASGGETSCPLFLSVWRQPPASL